MMGGQRNAWIWVSGAIAIASLTGAFTIWRYGSYAYALMDNMQCRSSDAGVAYPACARILTYEHATADMQVTAHQRLGDSAKRKGDHETAIAHYSALIALGRATAFDWTERGISYYLLHQYDKAAEDFQQATTMSAAEGINWSNLADAETELQKYGQAYDHYTIGIEKGDKGAEVFGKRAWVSYLLGNDERALADYSQAIAQDPQNVNHLNGRGLVRHALGDYEIALIDYDNALALKPDSPVVLTNRAVTYSRIKNVDKARQDFDRAIQLDPGYSRAYLEKAWFLVNQRQPAAALVELGVLERIGSLDAAALEVRSRARYYLADWRGTIADADAALAMGTTQDWPYELRAKAKREISDYEGAIADATVVISRNPKDMSILVTRALALHLAGRTDTAFADMDQAIAQDIDPAYAYETKSLLNLSLGRLKEAIADARQAVVLAPRSQYSASMLGWALLEDQDPSAAIEACSRSLAIEPTSSAYSCRAMAQLALHREQAAIADAQLAISLDGQLGAAQYTLGRIDLAQGRAAEAVKKFAIAEKLDIFGRAEALMYLGDAELALGNIEKARTQYQTAIEFDSGLHRKALVERLAKLPAQ